MIERHHDYVLSGITVAANGSANFIVNLDSDAPFALRCILSSGMPTSGNLSLFQFTIKGMDDRRYMGGNGDPLNGLDSLINPGSLPFIVYPQVAFPAHITIQVTVIDTSGAGISNGVMVFRGTKLYNPGTVFGPQYPQRFSELNFRYAFTESLPGVVTLTSLPLNIQSDADFVVRMCSSNATGDPTRVSVILRDQYGKPYSSDYVPIELLFPQTNEPHSTIYPEIYLIKSSQLLLDIKQTSAGSQSIVFVLHGSKVFESR